MEIRTCKANLEKELDLVARIIPARSTTAPILENIVIRVQDDICILANNTEIYSKIKITAMILEKGEVAVNGRLFSELIRKLPPDKEITIKIDEKDEKNQVTIQAGKSKVSLPYMDARLYPEPPVIEKENSIIFSVDGLQFRKAMQNTIYAAAKKENSNTIQSSMNLVLEKSRLYICSLDSKRVAKNYIPLTKKMEKDCNINIPINTCQEILKTKFEHLELAITQNHIIFRSGDFMLISSLVSGKYYDISKLGTENNFSVEIEREELEDCINRTLVLSDKTPIRMHIEENEMTLSCHSEKGKLRESIEVNIEGTQHPLEIGFNPVFLLEAIKAIDDDIIKLNFTASNLPCVIENDCSKHIILPVTLKAA